MGFFRRDRRTDGRREEFTVGVGNHRVVVGGTDAEIGVTMLAELVGYIEAVTGGAAEPVDGRDSVAVLSAKMDQAELVNDATDAVALALEELVGRGLITAGAVPPQPELPGVPARATHYVYIQSTHERALLRLGWLTQADTLLRAAGCGVLPPRPEADPTRRPVR